MHTDTALLFSISTGVCHLIVMTVALPWFECVSVCLVI